MDWSKWPPQADGSVCGQKTSHDAQSALSTSRSPDAQSECDHKHVVCEQERNDEWPRRCVDSEQLADGLRGGAVPLPQHRCECHGGDIEQRRQDTADEVCLSHRPSARPDLSSYRAPPVSM